LSFGKIKQTLSQPNNLPFLILVLAFLLFFPNDTTNQALALKPSYDIQQFFLEFWRLITGHLIHASWAHLGANLVNLLLCRLVFREWLSPKQFIGFVFFSALFISISLWFTSNLQSYVGFSGVFHGLLIYLLLNHWKASPVLFSIALVLLIAKIVNEQLFGASAELVDFIGIDVAINAHLFGFLSGFIFWLFSVLFSRSKK
jgi:rhomboid family GlyGly-CTERM serine protease